MGLTHQEFKERSPATFPVVPSSCQLLYLSLAPTLPALGWNFFLLVLLLRTIPALGFCLSSFLVLVVDQRGEGRCFLQQIMLLGSRAHFTCHLLSQNPEKRPSLQGETSHGPWMHRGKGRSLGLGPRAWEGKSDFCWPRGGVGCCGQRGWLVQRPSGARARELIPVWCVWGQVHMASVSTSLALLLGSS